MTDVRRDTRQRWSFVPALLVCAAAPAFFVLEIPGSAGRCSRLASPWPL